MSEVTDLRRLQLVELDLMKRFSKLCDENNLRYYMLGGTLLGAVRHGGFIPWDDDVDLCMPRPDFERFLALASLNQDALCREGDAGSIKVVSMQNDMTYRQGMAKITSNEIRVLSRSASIEQVENAWIDVIPLDGFPSDPISSLVHKTRLLFWKVMDATAEFDYVVDVKRDRGVFGSIVLKLFKLFCRVIRPYGNNFNKVLKLTDEALKKYSYDDSLRVINLYAARGFREIFEKKDFGPGKLLAFEDAEFMSPINEVSVLATIYGADYMTPPPEGERNWHNTEVVDSPEGAVELTEPIGTTD